MNENDTLQRNLQSFFQLATDMLWVLDEQGNILVTNAEPKLGYAPGELTGRSVLDAHPPEVRDEALRIVLDMLAGREKVCPLPLITKSGVRIPVETRVSWGSWDGKPAIFGSSRDVSELMFSNEKFSKSFNASPALMAIADYETGRFLEVNKAFLETMGYEKREVVGHTATDLGFYRDGVNRSELLAQASREGIVVDLEIPTITKDGRVLDGLYSAQTIKVGGHSYLFSMMLDNSERNRREKSQKRMLEFQEILLHAQTLLSSSSQEELDRVLEAMLPRIGQFSGSSQACIFRAAKSGDVAACASEWHSGGGRPPVAMDGLAEVRFRAWAPSLEHGPELCLESEASADARDPRRTLVIPIKGYGILLGALILFDMDGTADWSAEFRRALRFLASSIGAAWTRWSQLAELRYAESKARQMADEAEKENRDKTRFLAFMSHEIRTPMNGIINMTRFLLDTPLDERQRHYGEMLKSSGEVLLRVVNNILDYSKIDAGKLSAEAVRFDPASLAEAVLEPFALQAAGKGVGFEIGIGADIPKAILGDSHRFGQIMSNLAGNAVKFTEKGKVKIALGIESLTQNGVRLRLTVSDTGIGIGAEQLSRIFQPFEQTDRSVTRRFGGTGLGLAIVKELCDILGGRIEVRSTEGVGSEFTAVLPFSLADRPDSGAAGLSRNRIFVDTRVLVVEDQEISSMVAVEMLKNLGVEADIARNGEEALEALEAPAAKHFDLVLMDLRMPVMDGLEATRRIRESNSESIRNIPVIALTGFAMLDDRKASFSAGMNGHINKPLDPLILSDMLALWLPSSKVGSKAWQAADESAAIAAPVDLGLIAACLDELQQPLEDCEPATCMVVLDRLRQTTLPEWSRPAMSALFTMIADFDFKKAGPALAALVAAVKAKA